MIGEQSHVMHIRGFFPHMTVNTLSFNIKSIFEKGMGHLNITHNNYQSQIQIARLAMTFS
jgi:hypothetical protein